MSVASNQDEGVSVDQEQGLTLEMAKADLRAKRAVAGKPEVSGEILERVRAIEQASMGVPGAAGLRAAGGEDIERLALIDPLTELYNSKTFFKELKDEMKRSARYHRPLTVCVLSLDGFEDLVRQLGTLTGDAILKIIANVVRAVLREKDIPARYTPERFAIIFPEASVADVALMADDLRQRIGTQAISHNWQNLKVTASLGLACYPADAEAHDELVARAEQAMEVAAARGGDRVCVV